MTRLDGGSTVKQCILDSWYLIVQAKIVKYIAAEEEWLRLLVHELTPVIQHLHADELPLSE